MKLNVYLSFAGNCKEALMFYQSVLGGEIASIMTYGESPEDMGPADWKDKVMYGSLQVAGMDLMASDVDPDRFVTPQGYHISIMVDDVEEAERVFGALSEGGTTVTPLEETFWAARFGMLTDRFGISWMVNCNKA